MTNSILRILFKGLKIAVDIHPILVGFVSVKYSYVSINPCHFSLFPCLIFR